MMAALLGAGLISGAFGQEEHRVYTLYEGADILVGLGGELHPVRDVSAASWIVSAKGQDVAVSPSQGPISMKINSMPKLSDETVTLADLKVEGAYTPQNDPEIRLTRSLNKAADLAAGDAAAANQANAQTMVTLAAGSSGSTNTANTGGAGSTSNSSPDVGVNASDTMAFQNWSGSSGYDLLDVSFKVSSTKPLPAPYIVVITRFHEPRSEAGQFKNLIYAKALNPIAAKPEEVKFVQSGFPAGFELIAVNIHIYDRGEEIATNLSPKRREMPLPAAFDYIRESYLRAHKSDTLAPTPVMVDILPADFRDKVSRGQYAGVVYVKVSASGVGEDAYSDPACSKRINDPYLDSIVRCIRFEPALQAGKAVEGTSAVNLSRLRA
jgi:hypothetical protein